MVWKNLGHAPNPPQRKDYGNLGRPIRLFTNFFEVSVKNKDLTLYHYDVEIKDHRGETKFPKKKKMQVFEEMKKSFPKIFQGAQIGYDSMKNAYSTKLIKVNKGKPFNVEIKFEPSCQKASQFTVTMEKVNSASLIELFQSMKFVMGTKKELPTTITQMMEVMFRHSRANRYEQVGSRSFFSLEGEFSRPAAIGGGKDLVTGFFGSLRPAAWKDGSILLNVDMVHTAFYQELPLIEFLKENINGLTDRDFEGPFSEPIRRRVEKVLRGIKLRVTYALRTYKFRLVGALGSDRKTFDLEVDGKSVKSTVQQYMKNQYSINLRYPRVNTVVVGSVTKDINIPIELCKIDKGQKVVRKLNETETANSIRFTAVPPYERKEQINKVVAANRFKDDPYLQALTFSISDKPVMTEGRVLPAPGLTMDKKTFQPYQGVWDIRDKKFHVPAPLTCWAVINYDFKTYPDKVQNFVGMLVKMGKEKGMNISMPFDIYHWKGRGEPCPEDDFNYYKQQNAEIRLIMCILPAGKFYGAIKTAGDTKVNIITQCVVAKNVFKCQPQTVGNILLKINAKMGGINNILTAQPSFPSGLIRFAEPFLIMGADVNHPPAGGGSEETPSIAAVVASYDKNATKYAVERRVQGTRVEIITDLEQITKNMLLTFYRKTKMKPQRIIMYRDGVSESQFQTVLSQELKAMRKACSSMPGEGYTPGITFICVQKRHHTRLFCDERDGVGKSKNVPPGTIVDRDITHPTETDFYLCSHQGIQGTSKPTHYHLLWDDNDLPINELQMLTYRLCHVYSRCARTVSLPTPVYYAHLAAFRAKVYVQEIIGEGSDTASMRSGMSSKAMSELRVRIKNTAEVNLDKKLASELHYI